MESFSFYNPTKIQFGQGMISVLGTELKKDGINNVLMIAGGGSIRTNGAYEDLIKVFNDYAIDFTEAWGVRANPDLDKVYSLIETARQQKVDAIVAIGGGSVIDTAKAVAAGVFLDDIWDVFGRKAVIKQALPLYTVLTISATGSEMNSNFVITNTNTKAKLGTASPHVFPRLSIIDPVYQATLPPHQTVNGALDALAHILEFYFVSPDALVTLGINDSLQCNIIDMTDRLLQDAGDYTARANLALAATLALNGISGLGMKGGDWACHQIEHACSALNPEIAHGAGLGVIFPAWIEFMAEREPQRFYRWARQIWAKDSISQAVKAFRDKIQSWDSPVSLRQLGIRESDLPWLVEHSMIAPKIGGLSRFAASDVEALLLLAY